ncbi:MAG: non-ribosomal peptide synthetase, partial [Acidobacteria bacterium]
MSSISPCQRDTVTTEERGREFWGGVLLAGGFTALPRWTLNPASGTGEHEAAIPDGLVATLRRLAIALKVPLSSVLLAGHAKVLGALSGERDVCTGYAGGRRSPLPLRMTLRHRSWREALREAARAESELLAHRDFPVDELARELGLTQPPFETVFELAARGDGNLIGGTVMRVAFVEDDRLVLRLRYRMDALDAECAARVAGY